MLPLTYSRCKTLPFAIATALLFLLSASFCSCQNEKQPASNGAFSSDEATSQTDYDLDQIRAGSELIVATMSGPESYYDYHGIPMGLQYALVEDFAKQEGLRVRVEVAADTASLVKMLQNGDADIIALQLPQAEIKAAKLGTAGAIDSKRHTSWAIRPSAEQLKEALNSWFGQGVAVKVRQAETRRDQQRSTVSRQVRAPYLSRAKGIISTYDNLFHAAAAQTGWDWRLIAAQCYQESGFDPNARSWAGAQGLMQIMPATATQLGLSQADVFSPRHNVAAAARYINMLNDKFSDIHSAADRICFVLAAYNGGYYHIRDAQALARKYGCNASLWNEVASYVLKLSQPRFYRDPVVKHGYMIGSETYNYVSSIMERWKNYGGNPHVIMMPSPHPTISVQTDMPAAQQSSQTPRRRQNRFTKGTSKIYSPDDPEFNQMPQ